MEKLLVENVMHDKIIAVKSHLSLHDLHEAFKQHNVTGFAVVDESDKLVGVVSLRDLVEFTQDSITTENKPQEKHRFFYYDVATQKISDFIPDIPCDSQVKDIMTKEIVCVEKNVSLIQAAKVMSEHKIHRLIVTEDQKIAGIISAMDIVNSVAQWKG